MYRKQIMSKFLLISISVFLGLMLCICAIIGSSKSAEAKGNPSNDFSINMKCSEGNSMYVFSQSLEISQMCTEFAATDFIEKNIEEKLPGATLEYVLSESYYGKSTMGVVDVFGTLVILKVNIIQGDKSMSSELELFFGMYDKPSETMYCPLEYVNGLHVDLPNIDEGAKGISMVDGRSYLFTDYPYSENFTIAGNVVDQNGNAVDGAKVSLTPENAANAVAPNPVLTVNGTFAFENVDAEILPALLNVQKDGYTFEPVRITENDIVDGKIILSNLVLQKVTETAKTMDTNYYLIFALMSIAICGFGVLCLSRAKNQK